MAFDGITIACITKELQERLTGGRIYKIAQPEADELLITVRSGNGQYRLFLSANASLPLVYLVDENKPSPMTAPNFCMLLRKHIQNGRITAITQPGLERIIRIDIEHLNEMGDLCSKSLYVEIMGKHSNIIFCDDSLQIIDSIKHVSGMVSSVREVLPGRTYFIPQTQEKSDPLSAEEKSFGIQISAKALPVFKSLYMTYTGLSPVIAHELCFRAGIDSDKPAQSLDSDELTALWDIFSSVMQQIKSGVFSPNMVYENHSPSEYACIPLTMYTQDETTPFDSPSDLLHKFYAEKNTITRIRQKSSDLRRIVQTALERNIKKYDLQCRQMKDTEKRDTYKVYGELLNTYGYNAEPGSRSMEALNYYTNEMITIPLDPQLTPSENAKKYFDKYCKMKRTFEALEDLTAQVKAEIDHLESIATSLDIALKESDLVQIKEELIESGYIRRKGGTKKPKITSQPFHYRSSDGYDIYVGKNNYQNDELTFRFASGNDWWFHAKGIPGSHVVLRSGGQTDLPDRAFEEAGKLAAYYSKGRGPQKIEIDYTLKKNVKKPGGNAPGFVVYYTNYSLVIDSDISSLTLLSD
ncbi:MAG: NFACT RNA binding domain-containing protein [Lachnospiraceae bacterium]|nr:NFACT RNA binding domain-containing protein [Lachnospiraceae bacterium]